MVWRMQLSTSTTNASDPFLTTLANVGILQREQIPHILHKAHEAKLSLIVALSQQQSLDANTIAQQLAVHLALPFFDLAQLKCDAVIKNVVDETFVRQQGILPLFIQDQQLYLAISEPSHLDHLKEVKFHTDLNVWPVVVAWDKLMRMIDSWLSESQYRLLSQFSSDQTTHENDNRVIFLTDQILQDAIFKNASDIHIEPYKTAYRIRFRLDGILHKITQMPLDIGSRISARLKVMSRLDMAERRLPQDGRFSLEINHQKSKDCRISVCPTLFGEKIVIRILDAGKISLDVNDLGLESAQKALFLSTIQKPHGMILVTGPTGSGKTVTLYTALHVLNTLEKNICTVEEPVEITMPGINQSSIDSKIKLTFAKLLRAFLRQDPDILMVGEIRDQETAETAVKAAQTGHLVLSTLHTNSAVETLTRLSMLGISKFNIAHSVQLVMAQRLIRKLCEHCKQQKIISAQMTYEAVGCERCMKGYSGRVAIFECLPICPEICQMIMQEKSNADIIMAAKKAGMITLREAALSKVKAGITSIEEMQRVIL